MKKLSIILILAARGTVSFAQDTAYISRDRTTALFFNSAVKIIGKLPADLDVVQKGNGIIALRATSRIFNRRV
ncbi:hypothetical protein HK413_05140 [Mucilaginibacter sp. S1162]|uniref:Uncharacterized protein n=1 Tax=Mucilaginibacter humi TaxID=2732510 RepID=A0ABX1W6G4_9SPHI|nr:hypothetical protein [Mucilaginibacter humi]NNU33682.1 hypothetical protein [Mucilaginibacter humi]